MPRFLSLTAQFLEFFTLSGTEQFTYFERSDTRWLIYRLLSSMTDDLLFLVLPTTLCLIEVLLISCVAVLELAMSVQIS